jgi:hypothetical protein
VKKNSSNSFLRHDNAGGIAIEFALVLPVFLTLCLPVVDYGRYILLQQKLVKAASFMADAVSLSSPIKADTTQADIDADGLYITQTAIAASVNAINTLMLPFTQEQQGGANLYQAVITHVYKDASGSPALGWQFDKNSQSFYDGTRQSDVGVIAGEGDIGSPANIPAVLANNLDDGENIIVAELSAQYDPITPVLGGLGVPFLQAQEVSYTAYYRARYGNLKCVWGVYMPPPDCNPVAGGAPAPVPAPAPAPVPAPVPPG